MHQNGLPQSVSQLALQARERARAWRKEGVSPFPETERWKQVSVRERSGDVSGDTASSNNPAGMFTTNLDFTGPVVIKMRMEPVQVAFSLVNKESIHCVQKKKHTPNDQI